MKANEAPEKIYLFENPIDETPDYRWLSKKSCDEDIEYTRTDAFIEKACEWLEDNLVQCWIEDFLYVQFKHHEHQEKENVLADFRKSMEE